MLDAAPATLSPQTRKTIVAAIAKAIQSEAHVLADRPDLLWQQLYNRLQWVSADVCDILAPELAHRLAPDAAPWLWVRTPPPESPSLLRKLTGHLNSVYACSFSPDGNTILSGDQAGQLRLWDGLSGQTLATFWSGGRSVTACAFNSDGTRFISSDTDGAVRIWDTASHACLQAIKPSPSNWSESMEDCAYSPNGATIAAIGSKDVIYLWDSVTGERRAELTSQHTPKSLAFSPDGATLLVATFSSLTLWNLTTLTLQRQLPDHTSEVLDCAFSPTGDQIVSAHRDGTLTIWDARTGKQHTRCEGHRGAAHCCAFSPDGTLIASGGNDMQVRLWSTATGREVARFAGHAEPVRGCAFGQNGDRLLTASDDTYLLLWDLTVPPQTSVPRGHTERITACALSSDARLLLSASVDGTLKLWDADSLDERFTLGPVAVFDPHTCAFSPDGAHVLAAISDGAVGVWDTSDGHARGSTDKHGFVITAGAWSPNGDTFVSGNTRMFVWSMDNFERPQTSFGGHTERIRDCAFSPDGRLIVTCGDDRTVTVREARSPREHHTLTGHTASVRDCAFTPDGTRVISADTDNKIRVWDLMGTHDALDIPYRFDTSRHLCPWAISPDGSLIAASGHQAWTAQGLEAGVSIWDVHTGQQVGGFLGHRHLVAGCAFSPDGYLLVTLATGSYDRMVKVWSLATGRELAALPLPDQPRFIIVHPWRPRLYIAGGAGWLHAIDIEGVAYGPLVVTAVNRGVNLTVRCPACGHTFALAPPQIGATVACPRPDCRIQLRTNPFVTTLVPAAEYAMPGGDSPLERPPRSGDGSPSNDQSSSLSFVGERRDRPWWRFWRRS